MPFDKQALSPRGKPAEDYAVVDEAVRDSTTNENGNTNEDTEGHAKHEGEEILISGDTINNLATQSDETELGSSTQFEHQSLDFSQPKSGDSHEGKFEERITQVSRSIEAEDKLINTIIETRDEKIYGDQNSDAIIDSVGHEESLLEVVPVNQSSPSSPMSPPIERTNVDEVFSSNLVEDRTQVVKTSLLYEPPFYDHSSQVRPQNEEDSLNANEINFETFQVGLGHINQRVYYIKNSCLRTN